MAKGLLDKYHIELVQMLLGDPKIAESVLTDIDKRETYKDSYINEDGSIVLGKRSIRWWNRLFNLEKTISFKDFAFNTFRALVGLTDNLNRNKVLNGLSQEIITKAVLDKEYEEIVDRLFDVARFGAKTTLNSQSTPSISDITPELREKTIRKDVRVIMDNGGLIPVRDSVGNVLLHLRVKFDGYTFDHT